MGRLVDTDDLIGATEIGKRVGAKSGSAKSGSAVHVWRRRFPDFPEPVLTLEVGMLFLWPEVERWAAKHRPVIQPAFDEPMMTITEAAERLRRQPTAVCRSVKQGRFTATRPRPALIPARAVEAVVERVRVRPWVPFADEQRRSLRRDGRRWISRSLDTGRCRVPWSDSRRGQRLQLRTEDGRVAGDGDRRRQLAAIAGQLLVTGAPYRERREILEQLALTGPAWCTVSAFDGAGAELFAACTALGLERLVAKRLDSRYEPGVRSKAWIKAKCSAWLGTARPTAAAPAPGLDG